MHTLNSTIPTHSTYMRIRNSSLVNFDHWHFCRAKNRLLIKLLPKLTSFDTISISKCNQKSNENNILLSERRNSFWIFIEYEKWYEKKKAFVKTNGKSIFIDARNIILILISWSWLNNNINIVVLLLYSV